MDSFRIVGVVNPDDPAVRAQLGGMSSLAFQSAFSGLSVEERVEAKRAKNVSGMVETPEPPTAVKAHEDEPMSVIEATTTEKISSLAAAYWKERLPTGSSSSSVVKEHRSSATRSTPTSAAFSDRSAASIYASRKKALEVSGYDD